MKQIFNFSLNGLGLNLQKTIFLIGLISAFEIGITDNANAQRRGGYRAPSWHYADIPARGAFYRGYPRGAAPIFWGGRNYYFHGGVFYHPYRGGFVIAPPPFGLRI